jgi:5-methylcytosine-specific restriction endonuclease McrA
VLDRDAHRCQLPGRATTTPGSWAQLHAPETWPGVCGAYAHHADHLVRREDGGSDEPANLRASCSDHNLTRGTRTDDELLAELLAPSTPKNTPRPTGRWAW